MSLRLRAVLIASLSLILLWVVAAALMMRGVHSNLDRTLDGRLAMSARMVSGLLERAALAPNAAPSGFTEAVRVSGKEGIACEIRSLQGEVLARTTTGPHSSPYRPASALGKYWGTSGGCMSCVPMATRSLRQIASISGTP